MIWLGNSSRHLQFRDALGQDPTPETNIEGEKAQEIGPDTTEEGLIPESIEGGDIAGRDQTPGSGAAIALDPETGHLNLKSAAYTRARSCAPWTSASSCELKMAAGLTEIAKKDLCM